MAKVVWSKQAIENIHTASEYHRTYSTGYADAFIERIFEKALLLESFPQSERIVPEFNRADVRELLYKPYRIIYQLQSKQLYILAVHHGSQPLDSIGLFS